ncbi:iron-containing redox enzyme family protein [Dactylosporangium roseum]|uniref:Iron-containing redox enzyme family protein n=2 Tax=Dactylosporangium roseum TaxID=47989 RepID=A0ABY5ZHF3_9ACTN|nr:iron-containing redox enzyme family protein [Dactylosporangium roseum]
MFDVGAAPEDEPVPEPAQAVARVRDWTTAEAARFAGELGTPAGPTLRCLLLNCAPLALCTGAWLQWVSSAANAESPLALHVLALYASDIGVGYPLADRGSDLRAVLRRFRLGEQAPGVRLAASEEVENASFRLPALLLAMSRRPEEFLPELLGADLSLRAAGLPPPLAPLAAAGPDGAPGLDPAERRRLDPGAARDGESTPALARSLAVTRQLLADAPPVARRWWRGFRWAERELRDWCGRIYTEALLTRHPDYAIWRLICTRARQAAVYHTGYQLAGRPLAEWFAGIDDGPGPFLSALARSRLVRPGQPDRSRLLGALIGEKGRMFRIFTDAEVAVLRDWIDRLPEPGSVLHRSEAAGAAGNTALADAQRAWYRHTDQRAPAAAPVRADVSRPSLRHARTQYRQLLNRVDTPRLRRFAYDYTTRWLARSRYRPGRADGLPPTWDRENGLRGWLDAAHDRHARAFGARTAPLPSRAELIDSTLQLAPLIFLDGGWLLGFTDYQLASSPVGHFLFRTFWDELGNGEYELNHPKIYRDLLRQMGVDLPPIASPEFTNWPALRDAAFSRPVYWLSISRFPRTFMPEILGLNLAMELSGVGVGYQEARVALRHHGYSTQFVDLHNTIDNIATGHSAWAVDAIDSYLAELPAFLGPGQDAAAWARIRNGYRSLNPPDGLAPGLYAALRAGYPRRPEELIR